VQEVRAASRDQAALCDAIAGLRGHLGVIVESSALPVKPQPDFASEFLYF
jgi:hypothetical protein